MESSKPLCNWYLVLVMLGFMMLPLAILAQYYVRNLYSDHWNLRN